MNRHQEMTRLWELTRFNLSPRLRILLLLPILAGLGTFVFGLVLGDPPLVWQSVLVNFLYFSGLSFGGLIFSVILTITNAEWGRPIKRMAEAMAGFLPISAILLLLLFFGAEHIFPWTDPSQVIQSKSDWLNYPFFVGRQLLLFLLLFLLIWFYLKASLRQDFALVKKLTGFSDNISEFFIRDFIDSETEEVQALKTSKYLAPYIGLLFVVTGTVMAFDWIMSLDQEWFSTLFGLQHVTANLLSASALLIVISGVARQKFSLAEYITIKRHHDIGKLTFAGCLIWTYFVFSQILVIWYGNLPRENPYLLLRMQSLEWGRLSWILLVLIFIIPLFGLMSRSACNSIWFSRLIAAEILVGLWLEKFLLVVPSVQENMIISGKGPQMVPGLTFTPYDILITLGMGAAFVYCYLWFLQRVPMVPISDRLFVKETEHKA